MKIKIIICIVAIVLVLALTALIVLKINNLGWWEEIQHIKDVLFPALPKRAL